MAFPVENWIVHGSLKTNGTKWFIFMHISHQPRVPLGCLDMGHHQNIYLIRGWNMSSFQYRPTNHITKEFSSQYEPR